MKHTGNEQPPETYGKEVIYKTEMVEVSEKKLIIPGRWHHKHTADDLNWKKEGMGSATIGAIDEYRLV